MGIRVLVCGGRDFDNKKLVFEMLDHISKVFGQIDTIIHGDSRGADLLADEWAEERVIPCWRFPAKWDRKPDGSFTKAAGFVRNEFMASMGKPDLVIAFPGDRGTNHMIDIAASYPYETWKIEHYLSPDGIDKYKVTITHDKLMTVPGETKIPKGPPQLPRFVKSVRKMRL